jgi:hypothetical protein
MVESNQIPPSKRRQNPSSASVTPLSLSSPKPRKVSISSFQNLFDCQAFAFSGAKATAVRRSPRARSPNSDIRFVRTMLDALFRVREASDVGMKRVWKTTAESARFLLHFCSSRKRVAVCWAFWKRNRKRKRFHLADDGNAFGNGQETKQETKKPVFWALGNGFNWAQS